jgi:hypothetical protein
VRAYTENLALQAKEFDKLVAVHTA